MKIIDTKELALPLGVSFTGSWSRPFDWVTSNALLRVDIWRVFQHGLNEFLGHPLVQHTGLSQENLVCVATIATHIFVYLQRGIVSVELGSLKAETRMWYKINEDSLNVNREFFLSALSSDSFSVHPLCSDIFAGISFKDLVDGNIDEGVRLVLASLNAFVALLRHICEAIEATYVE